jgi:transcriptional regulator with XRE-family HTH domain
MKPASPALPERPEPDRSQVLTQAVLRAAQFLGLTGSALARVIGVSEASASRLQRGSRRLSLDSKEAELATLLIRVYRSLDALVGNDDHKRLLWMTSPNHALGGTPRELIQGTQGLVMTLQYLDALRAPA